MSLFKSFTVIVILCFELNLIHLGRDVRAAEAGRLNVCYSSIAATSITTWVPYEAGI